MRIHTGQTPYAYNLFRRIPENGQKGVSACIWVGNYCCMARNTRVTKHGSLGSHSLSHTESKMHDVNVTPQTKLSYTSTENSRILFNKSDSAVALYFVSNFWSVV
jgi:hypothetical protein